MNTYIRRPLSLFVVFFNSGPMALDHISAIKSKGLADHSKILGAFLAKELLQPENQCPSHWAKCRHFVEISIYLILVNKL